MRPSEILEKHREELRALMEHPEYSIHFSNLRVFGSVATGKDTEKSDIDFLVDNKTNDYDLIDIGGLYSAIEEIVDTKIDLVVVNQLSERAKKYILSEAKPV